MKKIVLCLASSLASLAFATNAPETSYEVADSSSVNFDENSAPGTTIGKDSITLSSAYFGNQYTNKQLAVFGLELLRGLSRFENFVVSNFSDDGQNVAKWVTRVFSIWVYHSFNTAYHEVGHGLRARAYGSRFELCKRSERNDRFSKNENFFKFFTKRLVNTSRAACKYEKTNMTDHESLVTTAAGMNNEVYVSERISRDFYDRGTLGFPEAFAYFYGKLSPAMYALSKSSKNEVSDTERSDDPVRVGGYYKKLGISATKNDIALGGLVTTLLSGTSYSIIKAAFTGGSFTPISFYNFEMPDTFSYVTSKGISYKLASAYRFQDDLKIVFGAEHVFHGKSTTELNLGFNKRFGSSLYNTNLEVVTTFCNGFNLEASCSIPVMNRLSINVGAGTYSCRSMLGERHAKNMENDKGRNSDIYVSVSYRY